MSKWIITFLSVTLFACSSLLYADEHKHEDEHEEHEAHVHGEAQLLVAVEGSTLEIEFHSPAMNIVGFEHKPSNEAQGKAVESAIATLKKHEMLFTLPTAAKCESVSVEVKSPLAEHDEHEHKDDHEHEGEDGEHSDITGHYKFSCADMSQLTSIEIDIFKQFPGTEAIEVQSISSQGQNKTELTPKQSTLKL
jgi:hypothetical protein